jgi:perosamine synthetase
MKRISGLERKYVLEVLDNEFRTSAGSMFASRLEAKFAEMYGTEFAISHINGTATLHSALAAVGVQPGDEVIVPPLTMASTSLAVLHQCATPVFADVHRKTFTIDPGSVEQRISSKTKAIMPVALFGQSPDYYPLLEIVKKHNLFLIEDNAQCFLGQYDSKMVGTFGDFSSYSFQSSKHMTSGEGGMLLTDDEELAHKARRFSSLGYAGVGGKKGKITRQEIQDPNYNRHICLGFNYRMSEVAAAVALGQLERLHELVEARVKVAKLFGEVIKNVSWLYPQYVPVGYVNTYWTYAVVLDTPKPDIDWYRFRDLFQKNDGDGIYAAWKLTYMEPLFLESVQKIRGVTQRYEPGMCPNAEYLQKRLLQFKTNYWDFSEAEQQAAVLAKTVQQFSISN